MSQPLLPTGGQDAEAIVRSSRDTFDQSKKRNFLINSAGLGIYGHGRIHQQGPFNEVYVGDLIHTLGELSTDDILLMEEQATLSHSDPLVVPSRLGRMTAMAMLPTMNTANGEGDLIAYYEAGVVAFDTHTAPRETKMGGVDNTEAITKGWDSRRIIDHRLNRISATGRYAVAVLPSDHFFRSVFGLHFLKSVLGQGTFKSEQVNRISTQVQPLLDEDNPVLLSGAACGFWLHGNRMFATTGMTFDGTISATAFGRGFVSWNQADLFTDDGTPLPAWEGLWLPDAGICGVHWFGEASPLPQDAAFGFIASGRGNELYFVTIDDGDDDRRAGEDLPVEWSFETARFDFGRKDATKGLRDGFMEFQFGRSGQRVRVLVRTEKTGWELWKEFGPDSSPPRGQVHVVTESFGVPPRACNEGTWFQVRVEVLGAGEVHGISLDITDGSVKSGRNTRSAVPVAERDPFETNRSPFLNRWQPSA